MSEPRTGPSPGRWLAAAWLAAAVVVGCGGDEQVASGPSDVAVVPADNGGGSDTVDEPTAEEAAAAAVGGPRRESDQPAPDAAGNGDAADGNDGEGDGDTGSSEDPSAVESDEEDRTEGTRNESAGVVGNGDDAGTSTADAGRQDPSGPDDAGSPWLATAKRGDSGDHVVALQERLNELGMGAGPADGDYGRRTEHAVRAFQQLVRLTPTGTADRITLNHLSDYRYDGPIMRAESDSAAVRAVQERLAAGPFDPGELDGEYGPATMQAVWALEKLAGIPVDGEWGPLDEWAWEQLEANRIGGPARSNDRRWVEVDLSQQLVKVYDPGDSMPALVSHASSGSGIPWENEEHSGSSITPTGDFAIERRISGWRESSLDIGRLYNPLYFVGGIAFHGSLSVPPYPASHGCIRLPMHVADYLPDELPNGTPVHVME